MKPWVVKIGGRLCEEATARMALARACAQLEAPVVIVHGGGVQVSELQTRLGLVPRFVDGRRATSLEDVAVVEMVLSGVVNKALVRALQSFGVRAVGLSGCDGALVRCARVPELGEVGAPEVVQPTLLTSLLQQGYTVVLSPLSLGPSGEPLNVNADDLACAVAGALHAEKLYLVSDVPGVRADGETLDVINVRAIDGLIARGVVTGGMIPKLRSAAAALASGVGEVRITGFANDSLAGGTAIVHAEVTHGA
jgi:acetylglutamate kinase